MKVHVFVDIEGRTHLAGHLYTDQRRGRLTSVFAYDDSYLTDPAAYPIDPALPLGRGTWPSTSTLPRAILDASPDRWGRTLIARRAAAEDAAAGRPTRTLSDLDHVLGVSDATRHGALRFAFEPDGPYQHPGEDVPPSVTLPALADAARQVGDESQAAPDAVRMLLGVGSASLGGARPKASVQDGARLRIAKFAHSHDDWDVMAWEATALDLAERAGITVPIRQLLTVEGSSVLLLDRFDRTDAGHRIGYMSALTLCQASDGDRGDYLDIAESLAAVSADPKTDLAELWRRIAYGAAINNTDDHLRNHGVLRQGRGWRLSPAFDMNPDPHVTATHATSVAGAATGPTVMSALISAAPRFGLRADRVRQELRVLLQAVSRWDGVAATHHVSRDERARFAPVFESGTESVRQGLAAVVQGG